MIERALAAALLASGCYGEVTTREEVIAACIELKDADCYRQMTCGGFDVETLEACFALNRPRCEEEILQMTCWDEQIAAAHRCIGEVEARECSEVCPRDGCVGHTCRVECP